MVWVILFTGTIAMAAAEAGSNLPQSGWGAMYPGQGSQNRGMGEFLHRQFPSVRALFEEASDRLNVDFVRLCFQSSECELALTENTQPCLLLVSTATQRVLRDEIGFEPVAVAGHSLGEYSAAVCAGAMGFADAVQAVSRRGKAMQTAVPAGEGGMLAAIGMTLEETMELCAWAERESKVGPVEPANFNAPGQVVLSGRKSALDWLVAHYEPGVFPKAPKAKFIPLNVSAPFHCSMMRAVEQEMTAVLNGLQFSPARVPVLQNVSAEPVRDANTLRENLIRQISAPVRWMECVAGLKMQGASRLVEVGCGKVLAGLGKKIDSSTRVFGVNSLEDLKALGTEYKCRP